MHTTDHLMDSATPITYAASVVTVISGLTINEWGVITGIIIGTATFAVNWWYKHKTWKHLSK